MFGRHEWQVLNFSHGLWILLESGNVMLALTQRMFGIPGAMLVLEASISYNKVLEELPLRKKNNSSLNLSHKTTDETVTGQHWNQRLSAGCQIFRVLYSLWYSNLHKKLSQVTFKVPWLQAPYCFIYPCICIGKVTLLFKEGKHTTVMKKNW